MKIFAIAICLLFAMPKPQSQTSAGVLKMMYARYHNKWQKSLAFNQTTERYRNDSLVSTATWYEHIVYPNLLRIDFTSLSSGNGVIFRNDSSYRFQNNKITKASGTGNELIFFLGGLYFMPFDSVLTRFAALHYDLSKFHEDTWKGHAAYVLGANDATEKVNQLWIDKEALVAVRFIKYDGGIKEEGWFENHIYLNSGWSETLCSFFINDHKLQIEKYHDVVPGGPVDMGMFEPGEMGK
jgi:hypothetical protein